MIKLTVKCRGQGCAAWSSGPKTDSSNPLADLKEALRQQHGWTFAHGVALCGKCSAAKEKR